MKLPDGRPLVVDEGILHEPSSEGSIIRWLPGERTGGYKHWERVVAAARATIATGQGVCSIAATSVPVRQRLGGPSASSSMACAGSRVDRTWTVPGGELAEQCGARRADLRLAWAEDATAPLDELRRVPRQSGSATRPWRPTLRATWPSPQAAWASPYGHASFSVRCWPTPAPRVIVTPRSSPTTGWRWRWWVWRIARRLDHLVHAVKLARALDDRKHEAELLWRAAIAYAELGDRDQATAYAGAAIDRLGRMGHPAAGWYRITSRTTSREGPGPRSRRPPRRATNLVGRSTPAPRITSAAPRPYQRLPRPCRPLRMAPTAAKAMATFVGSGFKTASPVSYRARLAVCAACEHHTGVRCRLCGCITTAKARMLHERCPMGRWADRTGFHAWVVGRGSWVEPGRRPD